MLSYSTRSLCVLAMLLGSLDAWADEVPGPVRGLQSPRRGDAAEPPIEEMEELTQIVASVKDLRSLHSAHVEILNLQRRVERTRAGFIVPSIPGRAEQKPVPTPRNAKEAEQAGFEMGRKLAQEIQRVKGLKDIPRPALRILTEAVDATVATLAEPPKGQMPKGPRGRLAPPAIPDRNDSPKIQVTFKIEKTDRQDLVHLLHKKLVQLVGIYGESTASHRDRTITVTVETTLAIEELAKKIDFAQVSGVSSEDNTVVLVLDDKQIEKLQAESETVDPDSSFGADGIAQFERSRTADFRREAEALIELLSTAKDVQSARRFGEKLDQVIPHFWPSQGDRFGLDDPLIPAKERDAIRSERAAAEKEVIGRIETELKRIQADRRMAIEIRRVWGSPLTLESLRREESMFEGGEKTPDENPADDDFFLANLNLLESPNEFDRQQAVERLSRANPEDCPDSKLRDSITKGIREVVRRTKFASEDNYRALAVWQGKQSIPIFAKLLRDPQATGASEIIRAMESLASKEAAEAIVPQLSSPFAAPDAADALRRMGGVAEEPLIAAARKSNPETARAAIEVLDDVGTRVCLPALRKAAKSSHPEVNEAARNAMRSVQERLREEKQ